MVFLYLWREFYQIWKPFEAGGVIIIVDECLIVDVLNPFDWSVVPTAL
jgi:hypothetical protein